MFHRNYIVMKEFVALLKDLYAQGGGEYMQECIENRFNVQTYFNVLQIEVTERYITDIDRVYELTNDQLKPIYQITLQHCL